MTVQNIASICLFALFVIIVQIRAAMLRRRGIRALVLPVIRMGAADMNPKMKATCRKVAKRLYNDTASGKLHSPAFKQVFYYQLWRNMSKNDKTSADYKHWHESDLGKHDFAPVVKMSICKRLFGKGFNGLFGRVMKNWGT